MERDVAERIGQEWQYRIGREGNGGECNGAYWVGSNVRYRIGAERMGSECTGLQKACSLTGRVFF